MDHIIPKRRQNIPGILAAYTGKLGDPLSSCLWLVGFPGSQADHSTKIVSWNCWWNKSLPQIMVELPNDCLFNLVGVSNLFYFHPMVFLPPFTAWWLMWRWYVWMKATWESALVQVPDADGLKKTMVLTTWHIGVVVGVGVVGVVAVVVVVVVVVVGVGGGGGVVGLVVGGVVVGVGDCWCCWC